MNKPMGKPLPQNEYHGDTGIAYECCLSLEKSEGWLIFSKDLPPPTEVILSTTSPEFAGRVLGYGIIFAPNEDGRAALVRDILACERKPELLGGLAHLYVHGLCRIFFNPKGPTPHVTPGLTPRRSLEDAAASPNIPEKSTSDAARLRRDTLKRDDNRCVFTGFLDYNEVRRHIATEGPASAPKGSRMPTSVAHIISQSLSENILGGTDAARAKFEWARTAGAMLDRFGGFKSFDILGDENLHSPKNAFTASFGPHELFDKLDIYLTPVENEPDVYNLHYFDVNDDFASAVPFANRVVRFRSWSDGERFIPAPDPQIIALHAACARISHMSGAAGHIEEYYRDVEDIAVMTAPGAALELTRVLQTLQMVSARA